MFDALPRSAGVLMPVTSLPGGHGCGDAGGAARRFVDWLASGGAAVWQVLPIVPPGRGDSPYSSPSAFALSPLLIPLDDLVEEGLLDHRDLSGAPSNGPAVNYAAQRAYRGPLLRQAAEALWRDDAASIETFAADHPAVAQAVRFQALRRINDGQPWWRWGRHELHRDHPLLRRGLAVQFLAHRAWARLKKYANEAGISIFGDLPIGVDQDSADVWQHRELFAVADDGRLIEQQGVPPDAFSETGQLWRMPCLDWDAHRAEGFRWWVARMTAATDCFDLVRIDHFRGLDRYFAIDGAAQDARGGRWHPAPGRELLQTLSQELGSLPLVAEDLGIIDAPVRALRDDFGLPGMHVLQFADTDDPDCPHRPENHRELGIAYWGTHDNETTAQWLHSASQGQISVTGLGSDGRPEAIAETLNTSASRLVIHRVADLAGVGAEGRINSPGAETGQWRWRHVGDFPPAHLFTRA